MKRLILKSLLFCSVLLLVNLSMGLLRLKIGDEIPYTLNKREEYVTTYQYDGFKDSAFFLKTRTDMGHDSIALPTGVYRIHDQYGFSNVAQNKNPEVLFIGDSFFGDPHINSTDGLQALMNKKMGRNCSYNIGNHGCSRFSIYNELSHQYFSAKPKIIFYETIERALPAHIAEGAKDVRTKEFKSRHHHYYGLDLLLGANFKDLAASKLLFKPEERRFGQQQNTDNGLVWFYHNKLSSYGKLEGILNEMELMRDSMKKQNIQLVFVVAPDKESLYPKLFGTSALEELHRQMKIRNIEFLDAYSELIKNPGEYYFRSDTHWNGKAIDLVTSLAAGYCQQHLK